MEKIPIFRFAPSPNGALHLGHAYSALLNHALAERLGGRFLLRVEDIDVTRCTPALEAAMLDELAWLGLHWEEPVMRQSERFDVYGSALENLEKQGFLYPAFMTRSEIKRALLDKPDWPHDPDGSPHYPGEERNWSEEQREETIAKGRPFAWRLDMAKVLGDVARPGVAAWGDVIIARKDIPTSYHLSVVLDDAAQSITHIVRGQDLEAATPLHNLLQDLLGLTHPVAFHHRLILDANGKKLSKSERSTGIGVLRQEGASPDDVRKLINFSENEIDAIATQMT